MMTGIFYQHRLSFVLELALILWTLHDGVKCSNVSVFEEAAYIDPNSVDGMTLRLGDFVTKKVLALYAA